MAIIVNTNVTALKTQKNLNNATNGLSKSLERMSTGLKINKAADDAANMYVATGLETQIRGSKVAKNNVATGNNVLQIMEGDIDVIMDNLNRIRDLAVQAGNSIYSADAMNAIKLETEKRLDEIDRIALASNFNGLALLTGDVDATKVQVNDKRLLTNGLRLQVAANADANTNAIILTPADLVGTTGINSTTLGSTATATAVGGSGTNPTTINTGSGITDASLRANLAVAFTTSTAAATYITVVDNAINTLATSKSKIGAVMNRLETAEASLTTTIENNTAAKSTIMDADIAEESANYTKNQILQQTSAALLVQANALPQIAISLVQG